MELLNCNIQHLIVRLCFRIPADITFVTEMEVMKTNKLTDVSTRVTCSRPSRRRELYSLPWDRRRHSDHRRRVQSAGPRIDNTPPASSVYTHVRSDNTLIHNNVMT